jgi:hypothetical protein
MKLNKKQIAVYSTEVKSFVGFYELKCHLPGLITEGDIEVRKDLCPESVSAIFATSKNYSIDMDLWFDTEYGSYRISIFISLSTGYTEVKFDSPIFLKESTKENSLDIQTRELTQNELSRIESKCLPIIESFLDTIDKLERNKPCENDCYYKKHKDKNGRCDKMYISRKEYTPEKDRDRQRIALVREKMKKLNMNI